MGDPIVVRKSPLSRSRIERPGSQRRILLPLG